MKSSRRRLAIAAGVTVGAIIAFVVSTLILQNKCIESGGTVVVISSGDWFCSTENR